MSDRSLPDHVLEHARRAGAEAPPLTTDQIARLARILRGGGTSDAT